MRYNTLSELAFGMHREAGRSGGPASIALSNVRGALGGTLKYGWGPFSAEFSSIARFARDVGFEYLSQSLRNGHAMCNFWRMPDDEPRAIIERVETPILERRRTVFASPSRSIGAFRLHPPAIAQRSASQLP
jgi:hypothetical protein